jgi:hypothetical protein
MRLSGSVDAIVFPFPSYVLVDMFPKGSINATGQPFRLYTVVEMFPRAC